jgi:hypothetical protein
LALVIESLHQQVNIHIYHPQCPLLFRARK